ncbi:MAG: transposase [Candidatus Firestonebacteria bacterium]
MLLVDGNVLILRLIKRLYKKSDRESVHFVEESMYAQKFCDIHPSMVLRYMNPANGLSNFRKKIGKEGLFFIEEVLQSVASKKVLKKGNKLIVDTTCISADIIYPTDIRLLERCRKEIIKLLKKAKEFGVHMVCRTYNRTARKIFVEFSKMCKPKEKTRKKTHKQMIQFVSRNFKQLNDLRDKCNVRIGKKSITDSEVCTFLKRLKESENKIRLILHQQKQRYKDILHIPERIVSFHKDHIRPIVRGKFPLSTEFGPKILVCMYKGYTHVVEVFRNNVSDSGLILNVLRWFKNKFGCLPEGIFGDRGFFSSSIKKLLEKLSIGDFIQPKGKIVKDKKWYRGAIRGRLPVECRISLGKRKFGWDKCRARNNEHEENWIRLQAAAMNVHLRYICGPPKQRIKRL